MDDTESATVTRDELIRQFVERWRDDPGATYRSWFLWDERIKNFRSIRRGLAQIVEEIQPATSGTDRPRPCRHLRGCRMPNPIGLTRMGGAPCP